MEAVCSTDNLKWIVAGLVLVGILNSILEYWLGKTQKVAASSVLEAVLFGIKAATGAILNLIGRKKDV